MGCSASSPTNLKDEFQLMQLAQSEGLFCPGPAAHALVRGNPGVPVHELFEKLRADLRPLHIVRERRDPRTLSNEERLAAAAAISDQDDSQIGRTPPVPLWFVDLHAPVINPHDLPESLRTASDAICAVCTSELMAADEDAADDEARPLGIRQLPCSHPFHAICIDPWLTAQSALCPCCIAPFPQPPQEETLSAYDKYKAAGGAEGIRETLALQRDETAEDISYLAEQEAERVRRRQEIMAVVF
jgi:hypothetical protein